MRQMISGLVAAVAVMAASAVPAMACGGGLFQSSCSPCGQTYVDPCAQSYVAAPIYTGCNTGCGGWGYERLPDPVQQYYGYTNPVQQYYHVNQGPTYTGPGNFAPYPTYQEGGYRHRPWQMYRGYRNGYAPRYGYASRYGYAPRHHYGYREHVLRRYY
jgi:hypothetical protein